MLVDAVEPAVEERWERERVTKGAKVGSRRVPNEDLDEERQEAESERRCWGHNGAASND